ncbi:MAG TPA: hypothetical protein VK701_02380, partial [Solirubrobacteraceae bacterium]|jgi:hypothetical protein|nr:hypothetical protein [Solirubrobacteraceae bacterium]
MSQRAKSLWILTVGLGASALSAGAVATPLLGVAGGFLTAIAAVAQYRQGGSAVVPFGADDWRVEDDSWILRIPYSRHGRRKPTVAVFTQTSEGSLEEVGCGIEVTNDDTVRVKFASCIPAGDRVGEVRIT